MIECLEPASLQTPPGRLAELLDSPSQRVSWVAAGNPNCPRYALALWQLAHGLSQDDPWVLLSSDQMRRLTWGSDI